MRFRLWFPSSGADQEESCASGSWLRAHGCRGLWCLSCAGVGCCAESLPQGRRAGTAQCVETSRNVPAHEKESPRTVDTEHTHGYTVRTTRPHAVTPSFRSLRRGGKPFLRNRNSFTTSAQESRRSESFETLQVGQHPKDMSVATRKAHIEVRKASALKLWKPRLCSRWLENWPGLWQDDLVECEPVAHRKEPLDTEKEQATRDATGRAATGFPVLCRRKCVWPCGHRKCKQFLGDLVDECFYPRVRGRSSLATSFIHERATL